ncbi:VanZ family protein [Gracilimonas aurantiaca]|uniref:VanZ family protein n=1 Tax=Gracilimonas aurantiaca TaxID=3234185 RepID=UPI00390C989C
MFNILLTLGILVATLMPADFRSPYRFIGYDKFGHFIMFFGWTFFFGLHQVIKRKIRLWVVFITGCIFGVITEVLQYYLPTNRSAEKLDLAADVAGAFLAVLAIYLLVRFRKLPSAEN